MSGRDLEAQPHTKGSGVKTEHVDHGHPVSFIDKDNPGPEHFIFCDYHDAPPGYPKLARYMTTAENLWVFRQFRYLQLRIMLQLQDELRELEVKLYKLDEQHSQVGRHGMLKSRQYEAEESGERTELLEQTRKKWMEYAELMNTSNNVRSLKNASRYQLGYVRHFFHPRPPMFASENFLVALGDLKSVMPDGDTVWLDEIILYFLVSHDCRLFRWLFGNAARRRGDKTAPLREAVEGDVEKGERVESSVDTEQAQGAEHDETRRHHHHTAKHVLYDKAKVRAFTMSILILLLMCFLAGPLYPLYSWVQGEVTPARMGMIMGLQILCTIMFGVVLSAFTNAKRHEIFVASATYMAILVVFMGESPE